MLIALLGASKGIGYHALLTLLADPANEAVLLLRKPEAMEADPAVSPAIAAGRVTIIKGDATEPADVAKLFDRKVDVVVTTVDSGGTPKFTLGGFKLTDPTVCTRATLALVTTVSKLPRPSIPRIIVVSSMGIGSEHHVMPFALRVLYPWMLSGPHADKEGLEYLFQRAGSGFPAPKAADTPPEAILSAAERDGAPENTIPEFTIVRPALLTDGAAAGPPTLKAAEGLATYTCSRRDVADFITRECLPGSDAWVNKCPILGY